jgi:probable phosphoglycerate mutase
MAIRCFLCGVKGLSSAEIDGVLHGDNTSVTLLEAADGKLDVLFYNDNSHLGEGMSTFARQKWWRKGSGADFANLRFVPLELKCREEAELYQSCYEDAWKASHGSGMGFVPGVYLSAARAHAKETPESLVKVLSGDRFTGIIELNPERGKRERLGWISLFYLTPEFRGRGFGIQLLGYSAAFYAHCGRDRMRLHAAVTNEQAIRFYTRYGFRTIGTEPGVASDQLLMERPL